MSNELNQGQQGNGGYERQDIGTAGVLYFLVGLAVAGVLVYFLVNGLYLYPAEPLRGATDSGQPAGHRRSEGHAQASRGI